MFWLWARIWLLSSRGEALSTAIIFILDYILCLFYEVHFLGKTYFYITGTELFRILVSQHVNFCLALVLKIINAKSFKIYFQHGCKKCGRLFCSGCTSYSMVLPEHGSKKMKVCFQCFENATR